MSCVMTSASFLGTITVTECWAACIPTAIVVYTVGVPSASFGLTDVTTRRCGTSDLTGPVAVVPEFTLSRVHARRRFCMCGSLPLAGRFVNSPPEVAGL
jgi:hypothetical protein